jgi:type IV secretion system protein VirD4
LYEKTKKERTKAKIFKPLEDNTYGYNPFYLLDKSRNQVQEAFSISSALIPLPPETKDTFWIDSARNMLTGFILYFHNAGRSFIETMTEILSAPVAETIEKIKKESEQKTMALFYLNNFIGMEAKTLLSIYSELSRHIMIFVTDTDIRYALSREENITPDDLELGKDIFICIPEYLIDQWKNLLMLITSQFLRHFERRIEEHATPILFLLDEFPRMGKVDGILNALATLRSKKITICPIVQSLAQLDLIYGKEARQVIVDNCQYKAILNATDADTQEYFSRNVGTHERIKISTSQNYHPRDLLFNGYGKSTTTEEKRKIKPEHFATLKRIALFTPYGFMLAEKAPYYMEN